MKILNKNFIDYIDYIKLENYRNSEALQLKYEIENYEEKQIKINIGDLASIFLIGKGNIDSEIYPKDLMDMIKDIINTFKEKPNLKYTIPTQTLKKLLNLVNIYRIDLDSNKDLAVNLAKYYNKNNESYKEVDVEFIEELHDEIAKRTK